MIPYHVDLAGVALPDLVSKLRAVPLTPRLYKELDAIYQHSYMTAIGRDQLIELRDHLQYMSRWFLPSFHDEAVVERRQYENRWSMLVSLCDRSLNMEAPSCTA